LEVHRSAPASVVGLRGESPLQADALRPVLESNCVLVTRGGKQLEKNDQSITKVNSIRPGCLASLLRSGEAQTDASRKPLTLRGSVVKRSEEQSGGWRWNDRKAKHMKQGDLFGSGGCSCAGFSQENRPVRRASRTGVRASIVASKPGNAGGAKGRRKVDAEV